MEDEMRRQREALYQGEKLSAMGQLLASVAHELNNPLSVVVGQSLLLQETAGEPHVVEWAGKIGNAADRCARIVKTFLAMARQQSTEMVSVALNEVVATRWTLPATPSGPTISTSWWSSRMICRRCGRMPTSSTRCSPT